MIPGPPFRVLYKQKHDSMRDSAPVRLLFCLLLCLMVFNGPLLAQQPDDTRQTATKKGWTFGALPAVGYNSDEGFRYGALANFFHYGDGSSYPRYRHSLFLEWSRTTKGNGFNNLFYDSWYLIPNTRTTVDLLYLTEQALDFYGFNGYEVSYNQAFEDPDDPDYISGMYYRHERKLLRFTADFQQFFLQDRLKWIAGVGFFGVQAAPVDIDKLNKGRKEQDLLPDVPGIYQEYVAQGMIPEELKDGGNTLFMKAGIIHDTRDVEANPTRGTWNESFVIAAPSLLGNGNYSYLQLVVIHRHYFSLVPDRLTMANRLGYQGKLAGTMPFYMLPFIFNSYKTYDAFGGGKTLRGIIRNRIQGDGVAYGNFELRYKFLQGQVARQDIYLSLNAFADGAMVVQKHPVPYASSAIQPAKDRPHWALGGGLRVVLNQNFVVAVDYGQAVKKEDGTSGLYIGLGFLF